MQSKIEEPAAATGEDAEAPRPSSWVRSYSVSSLGASPIHSPKVTAVQVETVEAVEVLEASVPIVQIEEAPAPPTAAELDNSVPGPPPVEVEVTPVETEFEPAPTIAVTAAEQDVPAPVEPVIVLSTELKEPDLPIESPVCNQPFIFRSPQTDGCRC